MRMHIHLDSEYNPPTYHRITLDGEQVNISFQISPTNFDDLPTPKGNAVVLDIGRVLMVELDAESMRTRAVCRRPGKQKIEVEIDRFREGDREAAMATIQITDPPF